MPTSMAPIVEEPFVEAGPRLKKFNRDECHAMVDAGIVDGTGLELIEGDILVIHAPGGPERRRWTITEVEALRDSGAVDVERLELIEGEIYDKMGKNRPHVITQHRTIRILIRVFGIDRVTTESSLLVAINEQAFSEPIPDVLVTKAGVESYLTPPLPQDVSLIVEVSDTTLRYDLHTKAALYARAGIVEYWVADLNGRTLIVHRDPHQGCYQSVKSYAIGEFITPLNAPDASIPVADFFV